MITLTCDKKMTGLPYPHSHLGIALVITLALNCSQRKYALRGERHVDPVKVANNTVLYRLGGWTDRHLCCVSSIEVINNGPADSQAAGLQCVCAGECGAAPELRYAACHAPVPSIFVKEPGGLVGLVT
jgi:hypothetical protein